MDTTRIILEGSAATVTANLDDRTLTGLLVPFGEVGRTNAGPIVVNAGDFPALPDPMVIGLNTDHARDRGVGRAIETWEEPTGIWATFAAAQGPEGDAALADAHDPNGKRRALSGEFDIVLAEFDPSIGARRTVPGSGRLWGAALVPQGAFPSARILAEEHIPDPPAAAAEATPTEGEPTMTVPVAAAPAAAAPASAAPVPASVPAPEPVAVAAAAVPVAPVAPVPATFQGAPAARTEPVDETAQVLAALNSIRTNPYDGAAIQVLAAIADITMSGTNTLPGAGVIRPNWLAKIYQGIPYVREYIQLGNLGTDISAAGKLGMKVVRGTQAAPLGPQDGTWQGNKNPINGYRGDSFTVGSLLYRFAVGNDIDRSLYDLPGGQEVVLEFLQLVIEDYLYWSDRIARETFLGLGGGPVAAKTYPAVYTANGTTALGMLIQGILAVRKRKSDGRRDQPTFAILNDLAFEQLAYAVGGDQNLPAFIDLALRALDVPQSEIGNISQVVAVNGDTGIQNTPSVLVGAKLGVDFDELPGGPLLINALDLAKGGIDQATHGYLQTFGKRPEAFVHVGTPDTWTASTAVAVGSLMKNGTAVLQATVAGTTGASAPTNPAAGATVTDGTATWKRLS